MSKRFPYKDRIVKRRGLYLVYAVEDMGLLSYRTDTREDAERWLRKHRGPDSQRTGVR